MATDIQKRDRKADRSISKHVNRANDPRHKFLAKLEEAEGGREGMIDLLSHTSDLNADETALVNALADPGNDGLTLGTIAAHQGLSLNKVMGLLAKSDAAKALRETRRRIFSKVPLVAEDVVDRAVIHTKECPQCQGQKSVSCSFCDSTGMAGNSPCPRCQGVKKVECKRCLGKGVVKAYPDLKRQQLALQMVPGILPQAGGNKQETHVNVAAQFNLPRNTVEFRAATDRLLFSHTTESETVDAEPISESESAE